MILLLVILFNCVMAFVGFRKGLYVMFATLFNQLFAIFAAVLSTRRILSFNPGFERSEYYAAATLLLLYICIFGLLQFLAWFYFLKDRDDYFPVLVDKISAVILGFLCGHLISCMILLSLCIGLTPFAKSGKLDWLGTRQKLVDLTVPGLVKACDFLAWYSLECFDGDSETALDSLLHLDEQQDQKTPSLSLPEDRIAPDSSAPKR